MKTFAPMLEDPEVTAARLKRVMKSSSAVENMVSDLIGKKLQQEREVVEPTIVDSKVFQNFIYGTILLNALTLGVQADLQSGAWQVVWLVFENIFTAVFTIEMVTKIYCLRMRYFWNAKSQSPQYWNLLDFVIAWLAIVDCWVLSWQANADAPLIRVMQLLRIIRIAKLLRLRHELVAIIEGLFSSLQCMVWIGFLLMIVIYAFSIVCRNVMGNLTNQDFDDTIDNEMYFGTLPRTMLTLFNICLIDNWAAIIWPQMLYNPWMVLPLIIFMSVTCFGLMNALIGVIVERTTAAQQNMSSLQEENIRETKMLMVAQLLEAIDASDEDKSGTINLQEFREVQRKPHAAEIFAALNLPPGFEAKDLFGLLDTDGNGVLDRYEFLLGICRLIWCDDFQSKCLMNHQIAQVREDIRSLRVSISDLSRTKVVSMSKDVLKSISETIRKDYQEILDERLARWELSKESNSETLRHEGVWGRTSNPAFYSVPDQRWMNLEPQEPGRAALEEAEGLLRSLRPATESWTLTVQPDIFEVVDRDLAHLTSESGAQRLMLRADGLLLLEGGSASHRRLQHMLEQLQPGGAEPGASAKWAPDEPGAADSGEETSSQPGDFQNRDARKGRRKPRRSKKTKANVPLESF